MTSKVYQSVQKTLNDEFNAKHKEMKNTQDEKLRLLMMGQLEGIRKAKTVLYGAFYEREVNLK